MVEFVFTSFVIFWFLTADVAKTENRKGVVTAADLCLVSFGIELAPVVANYMLVDKNRFSDLLFK